MSKTSQSLTAIPLGGLGEFGMNMMALRLGDEIIVVDAGMMFPESELLGVDLVIPDITYLKQNREQVRAIVLTHGHEDHIGALPYILRDLNVPVYGTRFTLALVKKRLDEAGLLQSTTLREVIPGRLVEIGPFEIEFISVTHSTVDCVALAIRTPVISKSIRLPWASRRSICTRSQSMETRVCWRCSVTPQTWNAPALRRRSGPSFRELKSSAARRRGG